MCDDWFRGIHGIVWDLVGEEVFELGDGRELFRMDDFWSIF